MPRAKSKPGTALNHAVGTLPALFIIACLTNPRVRFGRSSDKLNIWTPFRFYIGRIHPTTHVAQHPFHEHLGKTANARLSCRHAWDIKSIGLVARLRCIRSRAVVGAQPVQRGGPAPAPPPQKLWEHGFEAQRADD
jgi:hypothetical protein